MTIMKPTPHLIFLLVLIAACILVSESRCSRRRGTNSPCQACAYSDWGTWTSCSRPCGTSGTQTRTRSITKSPSCGKPCAAPLSESRSCNNGTEACHNRGIPLSTSCQCDAGRTGSCCQSGPAMIGISCDNEMMARNDVNGPWVAHIPNSHNITSVAVQANGTLIGVGEDNKLYTKAGYDVGDWKGPIKNSCCVEDVTVLSDGTIVGVQTKEMGRLVTRTDVESIWWEKVDKKAVGAVRVDVFPDGRLLGASRSGGLKIRSGVVGEWKQKRARNLKVKDIAIQPDGTILGIGMDTNGLHVFDDSTGVWGEMLNNTDCVVSIVSPGNLG